jgi:hypothetical protein
MKGMEDGQIHATRNRFHNMSLTLLLNRAGSSSLCVSKKVSSYGRTFKYTISCWLAVIFLIVIML